MANELETALKNAAQNIAQYIKEAATMTVETRYVEVGAETGAGSRPAARTVIKLDGDSDSVVPMRKNDAGQLEVDIDLFNIHQQNVTTVIEYRSRMLNALLGALKSRGSSNSLG